MKLYSLLFVFACLVFNNAHAQTDSTSRTAPASGVRSKLSSTLNVYSSQWLDAPEGMTVKPLSLGYSLYGNYKVALYDPFAVLMIGAGVSFTDFRTNATPVSTLDGDSTFFVQLQPSEYRRNKLSLLHIDVPLELRFSTRPKKPGKAWYIAPGFVGGVLVNDYVKRVWEESDGHTEKTKDYYTRNLSKYHYGPTVRLGYGFVGLYGYYGLAPLFEEGKGPGMTFYKVGLTFGGF